VDGADVWLHRKGATPADQGPVVIAGSRGTLTTGCVPRVPAWSIRAPDFVRTPLGSRMICENKDPTYKTRHHAG
jgi:hypothetical protein